MEKIARGWGGPFELSFSVAINLFVRPSPTTFATKEECAPCAPVNKNLASINFSPSKSHTENPKALVLFSGNGQWHHELVKQWYDVFCLDRDPLVQPEICQNILFWKYWKDFQKGTLIWSWQVSLVGALKPRGHYPPTSLSPWKESLERCLKSSIFWSFFMGSRKSPGQFLERPRLHAKVQLFWRWFWEYRDLWAP